MNNRIPCEMIADLFPLYAEKLTSEATNREIETHISQCESCRSRYDKLKTPVDSITIEANASELDYLRKIRSSNQKRVGAGILLTAILLTLVVLVKLFLIGHPVTTYTAETTVEGKEIVVRGSFYDPSLVYASSRLLEKSGQKELVVYACLPSFLNRSGSFELRYPKGEELVVNGTRITGDGRVISGLAEELYANKNPYIGDMSANGRLAITMNIAGNLGNFKNSLQTKAKPYGWTLEFNDEVGRTEEAKFNEQMKAYSYVLLAMIDNVEKISWTYWTGDQLTEHNVTAEEASEELMDNIKNYSVSDEKVQELLDAMGIK